MVSVEQAFRHRPVDQGVGHGLRDGLGLLIALLQETTELAQGSPTVVSPTKQASLAGAEWSTESLKRDRRCHSSITRMDLFHSLFLSNAGASF